MKKYSFIPLLLCASTLALAGCNLGGSSSKKSKKKSSSTETSQVSGSSQEGGSSNSSQGGGNTSTSQGGGATSTSQGGGGNTSTSGGGETGYTIAEVVSMINSAFSSVISDDLLEYNSTYDYYSGALDFSEDGVDYSNTQPAESVVKPVVQTLASYIPSSLGSGSYHFWTSSEDYWEDDSGDTVAQIAYESVPGGACFVELIGYCYNGYLIGAVSVFPAS